MSALSGTTSASLSSTTSTGSSNSDLGSLSNDEFFELIMAELSAQDPLEPNDTQALIEQISLIRSIESDEQMTESLNELADQSAFNSAAGMIGQLVSGITESGQRVDDLVVSVSNTADGPILNLLDGSRVPVGNVDEVAGGIVFEDDSGDDDSGDDDSGDDDENDEEGSP